MKYKPSRDLPRFALEYHTLNPTKLSDISLRKRNKHVRTEAISMWFSRHRAVYQQLQKEIIAGELLKVEVSETMFENGTFEQLSTVKAWIEEMEDRDIAEKGVRSHINVLKRICSGRFSHYHIDLVEEGLWCLKHPDRLGLDEVREIVRMLKKRGFDTASIRVALRDFLVSKGVVVGKKISGAKANGFGKLADLYVPKAKLNEILTWIKARNYEAYAIDSFMFKTGTRITATLKALIENVKADGEYREITVYDKGRRSKYPEGKPWKKHISADLWKILKPLIGDRKEGRIFNTPTKTEMCNINRSAFQRFIPKLNKKIPMPNHFWRHMFFQHMLKATKWNREITAMLGGSTASSLDESYGQPPRAMVRKWGLKYVPTI